MHSSIEFIRLAPELRRFARVVTGEQSRGDKLVTATLELTSKTNVDGAELKPRLFFLRALSDLWLGDYGASLEPEASTADVGLSLPDPSRRRYAYLLKYVAGLGARDVGLVMRRDPQAAEKLILEAEQSISTEPPASVLIIEDELFVATDLESIVEELGHHVVGLTTTRASAVAMARTEKPDLILSDVQLADGSNGIDAAHEISMFHKVSTVFITAFPERLLTGQGAEPTYLVQKPFQVDDIRANISQALFIDKHFTRSDPTLRNL